MELVRNGKIVRILVDPTEHFAKHEKNAVIAATGLLWNWTPEVISLDIPIKVGMENVYPFGVTHSGGQQMNEDFSYDYPGDPTQYPLVVWHCGSKTVAMYEHAMISWRDSPEDEWFHTRMD